MKSFAPPAKAVANRASGIIQRAQTPLKTIVDNRPTAVKQRKLQEKVNSKTGSSFSAKNVIQRTIRVGNDIMEDEYNKSYQDLLDFKHKIGEENVDQAESNSDEARLSDIIKVRKKIEKKKKIDSSCLFFTCEEKEHADRLNKLISDHNAVVKAHKAEKRKRKDRENLTKLLQKEKIIESYDFDFTCEEEGHVACLNALIVQHNEEVVIKKNQKRKTKDFALLAEMMQKNEPIKYDAYDFKCKDVDHNERIKLVIKEYNAKIEAELIAREEAMLNKKELHLEHQMTVMTPNDKQEVTALLKDWLTYVESKEQEYETAYYDLKSLKTEAIDANSESYYNNTAAGELRSRTKRAHELMSDFSGAQNEIKTVLEAIENDSTSFYLIARVNGKIQGLLEKSAKDSDYISNIAINPDNIVPRTGEKQVKNTLKDLLKSCINLNLETENKPLTLFALSNRVKKIYDHYGFRVIKNKANEIERPTVDRTPVGTRQWRTHQGYMETYTPNRQQPGAKAQQLQVWKDTSDMGISVNNQQTFINK